jgi:hypothetical protein
MRRLEPFPDYITPEKAVKTTHTKTRRADITYISKNTNAAPIFQEMFDVAEGDGPVSIAVRN